MRQTQLTLSQTTTVVFNALTFGLSGNMAVNSYPKSGLYKLVDVQYSLEGLPDGKPIQFANFGLACESGGIISSTFPQSSHAQICVGTVVDFSKIDQGGNVFFTYTFCTSQQIGSASPVNCKMVATFEQFTGRP